jgi:hypothetical protein
VLPPAVARRELHECAAGFHGTKVSPNSGMTNARRERILRSVDGGPERLKRVVLALPELPLRVEWLRDYLITGSSPILARELDTLCEASESSDLAAREVVLSLVMLLAKLGDHPTVERLRAHAEEHHLLSLARLLRRAPARQADPRPQETPRSLPVPDYGTGRELTVGERRSLARAPSRNSFDKLLADPHPLVIRQLLENPRLTEDDVVRLATRRPARSETISAIAQSQRWMRRSRVRLSILLNPGSPPSLAVPLLAVCTRSELIEVVHATDSNLVLRATALELLERRPPLAERDSADSVVLQ